VWHGDVWKTILLSYGTDGGVFYALPIHFGEFRALVDILANLKLVQIQFFGIIYNMERSSMLLPLENLAR